MLSPEEFRRIALRMEGAIERAHMGHPDFRAHGRIFATLHPDRQSAMVKLTPQQQADFVRADPASFAPEKGAWGRQGCTRVRLDSVDPAALRDAMRLAWQGTVRTPRKDTHPAVRSKRRR